MGKNLRFSFLAHPVYPRSKCLLPSTRKLGLGLSLEG